MSDAWSVAVRYVPRWTPMRAGMWSLNAEADGILALPAYASTPVRVEWRLRWRTTLAEDPEAVPVEELQSGIWRAGPAKVFPYLGPCFLDLEETTPQAIEMLRRL